MRDSDRHLDAEDLERYSMGTIAREETASVEEHLLACESCQDRLRETDEYVLAMRAASEQLRRGDSAARERQWRFPAWFPALAAVACCLLLVVVTLRFFRSPGPVVAVSLTALRGSNPGASAPAGRDLLLRPDLTALPESSLYSLEIVDQTGQQLLRTPLAAGQEGVKVAKLGAGLYFVRVYRPAGDLLREYGLEVH